MGAFVRIVSLPDWQETASTLAQAVCESLVERMDDSDVIAVVDIPAHATKLEAIEVFVQVNKFKHIHAESLVSHVADDVESWRQAHSVQTKVNVNVIPVEWYSSIGD